MKEKNVKRFLSVEPQGNVMTNYHWGMFCGVSLSILVALAFGATYEPMMYLFNDGENYQCSNFYPLDQEAIASQ